MHEGAFRYELTLFFGLTEANFGYREQLLKKGKL